MVCGRPMNNGRMVRRPPQTRYAPSNGAKIAYQVSGTGPPDLVMVPGLVSHLDIQWQQTAYRRFGAGAGARHARDPAGQTRHRFVGSGP